MRDGHMVKGVVPATLTVSDLLVQFVKPPSCSWPLWWWVIGGHSNQSQNVLIIGILDFGSGVNFFGHACDIRIVLQKNCSRAHYHIIF